MAGIIGLTDTTQLRHDGKIRGGTRDEKTGYPKNSPHFLIHEIPELERVLGATPTEIYFTVLVDHPDYFFHPDLRWYTKSELVCKSMHNHTDPVSGMPMGSVAAFFKPGQDVQGLTAEKFPGMRAFMRKCAYKACPDYIQGDRCGEHLTLDITIPQFSMAHMFRYEGTSINAILNVQSTLQKAWIKYEGKLAGQIFKLQKVKSFVNFPDDKKGGTVRRETDIVSLENVNFADYEARFKSEIDPSDWAALMRLRADSGGVFFNSRPATPLIGQGDSDVVKAQAALALPESPLAQAEKATSEDEIAKIANDPAVAPLFAELSLLLEKENSFENRYNTAKAKPGGLQELHDYLKRRVKELKKKTQAQASVPQEQAAPPAPPPTAPTGATIDGPPLY